MQHLEMECSTYILSCRGTAVHRMDSRIRSHGPLYGANPRGAASIRNRRFVVSLAEHRHHFLLRHQFQIIHRFAAFVVLFLPPDAMLHPKLACEEGRLGESFGQQVGMQSVRIVWMLKLQVRTLDQVHPFVCTGKHARRLSSFVGSGLVDQVRSVLVHLQANARQRSLALDHAVVHASFEVHVRRHSTIAVLDERDQPLSQKVFPGTQGIVLVQLFADRGQVSCCFGVQRQVLLFHRWSFFRAGCRFFCRWTGWQRAVQPQRHFSAAAWFVCSVHLIGCLHGLHAMRDQPGTHLREAGTASPFLSFLLFFRHGGVQARRKWDAMSPPEPAATTALVSRSFVFLPSSHVCGAARPRRRSTRQLLHPSSHLSPRACNVGTFEVRSSLPYASVDVDVRSISHLLLLLLLLLHVRLVRLGFSFVSMHPSNFVSSSESKPRRTTSTSLLLRFGRGCDKQGFFHDERTIVEDERRLPTRRTDGFAKQGRVDELLLRQQRSEKLPPALAWNNETAARQLEDGSFASRVDRLFFRSREAGRIAASLRRGAAEANATSRGNEVPSFLFWKAIFVLVLLPFECNRCKQI